MQELQPQLAEVFRTCLHPPSLLLRVANVKQIDVKHNHLECVGEYDESHRYASKFTLTDGKLMVQALLHRKLSGLKDVANVHEGDLLDIRRFGIRKAVRINGQGKVVYLIIEDCHFLLQPLPPSPARPNASAETNCPQHSQRKRGSEALKETVQSGAYWEQMAGAFLLSPPAKRPCLNTPTMSGAGDRTNLDTDTDSNPVEILAKEIQISQEQKISGNMSHKHSVATSDGVCFGDSKASRAKNTGNLRTQPWRTCLADESDDDEFFEQVSTSHMTLVERREKLRRLDQNLVLDVPPKPLFFGRLNNKASTTDEVSSVPSSCRKRPHVLPLGQDDESETVVQPQKEVEEQAGKENPRFPAQPAPLSLSRRDGTFCLSQPPPARHLIAPTRPMSAGNQFRSAETTSHSITQTRVLPKLPFHTLQYLRNPPADQPLPNKSYMVTTLAFIAWAGTSLIRQPASSFPPKRHLKIVDPSLASSQPQSRQNAAMNRPIFQAQTTLQDAVTVAVYLDAAHFKPPAGTLALFRGLVMQRLANGNVILNAYGSLRNQRFEDDVVSSGNGGHVPVSVDGIESHEFDSHWFVTNQDTIRALGYGSKLDYYLEWWKERKGDFEAARP